MQKISVAVLGCGQNAKKHFLAIETNSEQFEISAICDKNTHSLESYKADGVRAFEDIDELAAHKETSLVVVCTPSGLHAQQTIQLARAGKHVICEKPMALTYSDGLAMTEACEENRVQLYIVKQLRYLPHLQYLKKQVSNARFGKLYMVNVNVFWNRSQAYYDEVNWRGTKHFDGGALMNQASHYVDLICWLFGPVVNVQAMMKTLARKIETEDTCVINLETASGTLVALNITMLTYPKNLESSMTILGEEGTVKLGGVGLNQLNHWEFSTACDSDEALEAMMRTELPYAQQGMVEYYKAVHAALRSAGSAVSARDGLHSLAVMEAAYQSAHSQHYVELSSVIEQKVLA